MLVITDDDNTNDNTSGNGNNVQTAAPQAGNSDVDDGNGNGDDNTDDNTGNSDAGDDCYDGYKSTSSVLDVEEDPLELLENSELAHVPGSFCLWNGARTRVSVAVNS